MEFERRSSSALPALAAARRARRAQHGSLVSWLDPRITADETRSPQLEDCRQAEPSIPLYQLRTLFDGAFLAPGSDTGEKSGFLRHLYIKCIILPRQARDKHRESTQKRERFLAGRLFEQCGIVLGLHPDQVSKRPFLHF